MVEAAIPLRHHPALRFRKRSFVPIAIDPGTFVLVVVSWTEAIDAPCLSRGAASSVRENSDASHRNFLLCGDRNRQ
jgi:hypothetical protein